MASTTAAQRVLLAVARVAEADAIAAMLERAGHLVELCHDGHVALERLNEAPADAVIWDLELPQLRGSEALAAMAGDERLRHLPMIVLAAAGGDEETAACVERGAVDFLYKPVPEVLLRARMRACIERKQMRARERNYARLIEVERRRAELLLYDVLPADIAARMKHGEQLIADAHEHVTVAFADLVGFTAYAHGRPPREVVRTLDALFSRFDELASAHGVEKIKTIGDGYMVAAGLPQTQGDHTEAAADFALALRDAVGEYRTADGERFGVRVGMAVGPVVAGVIGQRRHVYDLWGDTVNIASRLETSAPLDTIQVTAAVARMLEPTFRLEQRGTIELKGRGEQLAYLLQARVRGRRATRSAAMARSARFEVKRALEAAERALDALHLIDPVTGLLTQRGFLPMMEAQWLQAARDEIGVLALSIHGLEPLADSQADALARMMRATFRDSDLLVRWAPSAFAVIGLERAPTSPDVLRQRLQDSLAGQPHERLPTLRMAAFRLVPQLGENLDRLIGLLESEDPTRRA